MPFVTRRIVEDHSSLALVRDGGTEQLTLGEHATISLRVNPAKRIDARLVFAGYGLTVPEAGYDDLAGLDLRGAVVVFLAGGPKEIAGPLRAHYQSSARYGFLARAGAIGTVTIPDLATAEIPWKRMAQSRLQTAMSLDDPALDEARPMRFAAVWNPAHANRLFEETGHTLEGLLAEAKAGRRLPRFPLKARLRARVKVERGEVQCRNVAGVLPGADPAMRDEYVVLSAHLDHLGMAGGKLHSGVLDNAAGVASLIEIARRLGEGPAPRRSLLFVALTGEEKGLLGSRWMASHPPVPGGSMVANLNMDMFVPLFAMRSVTALGAGESDLRTELTAVAGSMGIAVLDDPQPERNSFIRSDQYSFIRRGIPALAFKSGYEKGSPEETAVRTWLKTRYHTPADDLAQPVDCAAAVCFTEFLGRLAEAVAKLAVRTQWDAGSAFRRAAVQTGAQ